MRGHLLPRSFVLALAAMAVALPLSARADFESDRRDCARGTGSLKVKACTRLLQFGRLGARDRAVGYYNRGVAYLNLRQYRRALQDCNETIRLNPRRKLRDPKSKL